MKNQVFNPYLPLNVCIPDGEPHVFGDRLYVYGSQDQESGTAFCVLNYACWSAPLDDLSAWRCEGSIYRPEQDPDYGESGKYLYAPDVVKGNDGRYYLYYALAGGSLFTQPIHVAVCDTPCGKFSYYGKLRNPDGSEFTRFITFDPGVINDNGRIWLYYGWSVGVSPEEEAKVREGGASAMAQKLLDLQMSMFSKSREEVESEEDGVMGGFVVELASDMLTVIRQPVRTVPGQFSAKDTEFEGHAFFEASSIRKIGDTYYFIYSSQVSHELCYATGAHPDGPFRYGGVLISNGDIGYKGRSEKDRVALTGNNHGSIVEVNGKWYLFYHRQTHKTSYSRQGCAESIQILEDGRINQVEMTSCGLNGKPLVPEGRYPAAIACNLTNGKMPHINMKRWPEEIPYITNDDQCRYITDINDNTNVVFKYFDFGQETKRLLTLTLRGTCEGTLTVYTGETAAAELHLTSEAMWTPHTCTVSGTGAEELRLVYHGQGTLDFLDFSFTEI